MLTKCLCGNVHRNMVGLCPECGRSTQELSAYTQQMDAIFLAIGITTGSKNELHKIEKIALSKLAAGESLLDIMDHFENSSEPTSRHVALILKNLGSEYKNKDLTPNAL